MPSLSYYAFIANLLIEKLNDVHQIQSIQVQHWFFNSESVKGVGMGDRLPFNCLDNDPPLVPDVEGELTEALVITPTNVSFVFSNVVTGSIKLK